MDDLSNGVERLISIKKSGEVERFGMHFHTT